MPRTGLTPLEPRTTPATMAVSVVPAAFSESAGPNAATATITRTGPTTDALTVNLTGDAAAITVPTSIVIPAGQTSIGFAVGAVDDAVPTGDRAVTLTASAPGTVLTGPLSRDLTASLSTIGGAVAIQPDGRVIVAGTYFTGDPTDYYDYRVARFHPDGTADKSFGSGGQVVIDIQGVAGDHAEAVAVDSLGRIVVGGYSYYGNDNDFTLARLLPDGSPDTSFGTNGQVAIDLGPGFYNELWDLAIDPADRILAGGNVNNSFTVARYTTDGKLDPNFGNSGLAQVNLGIYGHRAFGLVRQPDGKVVIAGTYGGGNNFSNFTLVRFTEAGVTDSTFGTKGVV